MKFCASSKQTLERWRILLIVFGHHPSIGIVPGLLKYSLIMLWQRIPLVQVHEREQHRAAFPPARSIVVRRDLVESKFLVVVRTDPLACVQCTLLQSRIDIATRDLLWDATEFLQHAPRKSSDTHLEALEIVDSIDLLAVPATHLASGVAGK